MSKRRYSGNDRHLGPFTYSVHGNEGWRPFGLVLDSGGVDDYGDEKGCNLKIHAFGRTIICELPRLVAPYRRWVDCSGYSWAKTATDGYWDVHSREFGFSLSDGFLQVFLGPQTHDSITTKNWCCHLPWTDWRHVRRSLYDDKGEHFYTEHEADRKTGQSWRAMDAVVQACPVVEFEFDDYDGKRIRAKTRIEEREWRFGTKWCKWLSLFRKPRVSRSLNLDFSEEVGPEKGSWKGGTTGHGIEMLPGELHEGAFRRYCEQEHSAKGARFRIKFVGPVAPEFGEVGADTAYANANEAQP